MKVNDIIKRTKKIIDLPYNKFNLDNYEDVLYKNKFLHIRKITPDKQPIKLMSGQHKKSGIIHTYSNKKEGNIYLVGKGILFDSGGYDLKPRGQFANMKQDMAGMAIAIGVASYLKGNVIAYCPVSTNFVHSSQIIPGDIISIGKKKVEVTNTDAEGRLILAEALSTLNVTSKDIIITIATLTGCVGSAVGKKATGMFTSNDKLAKLFLKSSEKVGELAWRLPLWDYLQKKYYNKKKIQNSVKGITCGATEGAMFIKQFVKYPNQWIHLDCAFSAFSKEKKANGVPIKSLINFIKKIN